MMRRLLGFLRLFPGFLLITNSVLLGTVLILYIALSIYGTDANDRLIAQADGVFTEDWMTELEIPQFMPVQQLIIMDGSGQVHASTPHMWQGSAEAFIDTFSTTDEDDQLRQLTSALGQWLEPLRDRYPYIGRTPTFILRGYRQHDGGIVAVALWRPLVARLMWVSYAALIYLYLTHWVIAVIWVYFDSRQRGIYPWNWTLFTALANVVGLVAYLVGRNKESRPIDTVA